MNEHTLYGKNRICYTEVVDFTDFQGIGRDPLYKRFESVNAVIEKYISPEYRDFLAHPIYSDQDDCISWFGRSWKEEPESYNELTGTEYEVYSRIKEATLAEYRKVCDSLSGEDRQILSGAIRHIDEDLLFCYDGKVVVVGWGMRVDTNQHVAKGMVMHSLAIKTKCKVYFSAGDHGVLADKLDCYLSFAKNKALGSDDIPQVIPEPGYRFVGWNPDPVGAIVTGPMSFHALYEQLPPEYHPKVTVRYVCDTGGHIVGSAEFTVDKGGCISDDSIPAVQLLEGYKFEGWSVCPSGPFNEDTVVQAMTRRDMIMCRFDVGENGTIKGDNHVSVSYGNALHPRDIPKVSPRRGYTFVGWNIDPVSCQLKEDTVFVAQYEEKVPWFKRLWRWIVRTKFWLWLLLLLLLLPLLLFLLRDCTGSSSGIVLPGGLGLDDEDSTWVQDDPNVGGGGIYNPENPYTPVPTPPQYRDILPPHQGVLPPIGDDPEILPGAPDILADRLNVLMEDTDKSILDLAKAFKEKYPDDRYQVVYYDDVIKRMQITCPSEEREMLKNALPDEFAPEYQLFVFDEALFEGVYVPSDPAVSDQDKEWYLDMVNAFEGWDITMGDEDVVVAIVDDGFSLDHPELKGKVMLPYNVWLHSAETFPQPKDHGTHVAGIALAMADNGKGMCGIAPNCKFVPVQVADSQGMMTTTSIMDGILYAVYQGVDVLNVSLGMLCSEISGTGESFQQDLIRNHFREEERLWREIARIAANHKTTIVIAAGNDAVLAGICALQRPDNFIVVSAVDKNMSSLKQAGFSNYGEYSTISAPGVEIYSTVGSNDYMSKSGTSMAAPIVTGAVALMKSLDKSLISSQIITILQETGLPVNGQIGNLLQIDKALMRVQVKECEPTPPTPSGGDVQILLKWHDYNDLDLMCTDPSGEMISYTNQRSRSGGQLEIDMNVEYPDSRNPIENIFWPTGSAPEGTYNVYVKYFHRHVPASEIPYEVIVKCGGETKTYQGSLREVSDAVHVCSFTLGDPSASSEPGCSPSPEPSPSPSPSPGQDDDDVSRLELERDRLKRELDRVEDELRRIRNTRS